jgi:hypothetical protein
VTAAPLERVRVAVRVAATGAERDAAIDAWLRAAAAATSSSPRAIIAEGVLFERTTVHGVPIVGLTAGCPCCTGSAALRATLARTLRKTRAETLLLLMATADHVPLLRRLLESGDMGVRFEVET